ncbi:MAG: hypothetical protein ACM3X5_09360 [Bacillota bacterium]
MKKALVIVAVVLALLAGAAFWAYHSIDLLVKVAVEFYAPDVLGTSVKVGEVRISPKDGQGTVKALEIGNPQGFAAPRAARFGEIRVGIDPATVGEPVIVIHEIVVDSPFITYERGTSGTNLDAIQKNIERYVQGTGGSSDASKPAPQPRAARRFIVEHVAIRGAKVTMTNPALKDQGITFDLPDVELRDVGKRQNGLRASEVASIVTNALVAKIGQKVLTNIDLLKKGGIQGAVDALKGLLH